MSEAGEVARGHVRALAAAAGLHVSACDVSTDGVDFGFRFPASVFPAVEARVAWSEQPCGDGAEWYFDGLDEESFNRLAGPDFTVRRYLFLLVLPSDRAYASFQSDGMTLRHLGYFHPMWNEVPVPSPTSQRCRPVRVSLAKVLTTTSLVGLLRGVR